jgi:hypothetical protein
MIALNHVLTGIAVALVIKKPKLAVPLAFLSHFVIDAIPHFGGLAFYQQGSQFFVPILAVDGIFSVIAILIIVRRIPKMAFVVIACALAAFLPDALWFFYYWGGHLKFWFFQFHQYIQWYEHPPGFFSEAAYFWLSSTVVAKLVSTIQQNGITLDPPLEPNHVLAKKLGLSTESADK